MRKFNNHPCLKIVLWSLVGLFASCRTNNRDISSNSGGPPDIEFWITSGNRSSLFKKAATGLSFGNSTNSVPVIEVDTTQRFQSMDGFGYALTGGSAYLINQKLNAAQRDALIKELFLFDKNNIGISYLRVSIGSSDLDDHVFSYDDLPAGQTDAALAKFSLAPDKQNLIPVLKQILEVNPGIKIMGSPWSAPVWMKTNNSSKGGSLKSAYHQVYADYFVKYILILLFRLKWL